MRYSRKAKVESERNKNEAVEYFHISSRTDQK